MGLFGPKPIGLALGAGAARGLAHIGVLKALEAEGLVPDVIAGTSMGALIGALYASGMPIGEIEDLALTYDVRELGSLSDISINKGAALSGERLEAFLRDRLPATFEELRIPFGCVATDLTRSEAVHFTSGDLITAIRASVSVPLVFLPVRTDGMFLVDGDVSEPIPVSLAKKLGGRTIVAVDVSGCGTLAMLDGDEHETSVLHDLRAAIHGERPGARGTTGMEVAVTVYESFERRLAEVSRKDAHVVVSPDVHHLSSFEFKQAPALIGAGEIATRAALPEVRRKARR
jgi:NTE family protein